MGFFDKLLGRKDERPLVREGQTLTLRRREIAEYLKRPEQPNRTDEPQPPCETCRKDLEEVFITTGGPLGDDDVWRDIPIAVDGWACVGCGVFRYPRKIAPEQIVAWSNEGAAHGHAGRFAEAELAFVRIVWNWPGYVAGHVNYAEATRDRLRLTGDRVDEVIRRQHGGGERDLELRPPQSVALELRPRHR